MFGFLWSVGGCILVFLEQWFLGLRFLGVWFFRSFVSCTQVFLKVCFLYFGFLSSLLFLVWLFDGVGSCGLVFSQYGFLYLVLVVVLFVVVSFFGDLWGCDLIFFQELFIWFGFSAVLFLQEWFFSGGFGCDLWFGYMLVSFLVWFVFGDFSVCLRIRYWWGREQILYQVGLFGYGRKFVFNFYFWF